MERSEKLVKEDVKKLLRKHGAYWYMVVPGGFGARGVPDFLVCHKGRFLAVETKRDGITKPSPHQELQMDAIEDAGGGTMVINAANQHLLEDWLKK